MHITAENFFVALFIFILGSAAGCAQTGQGVNSGISGTSASLSTNSQYVLDCDVDNVEFELQLTGRDAVCGAAPRSGIKKKGAVWNAVWCKFGSTRTACNCEKRTISIEGEQLAPTSCKSWRVGPASQKAPATATFKYQAQCEAGSLELALETRTANALCGGVKATKKGKILNAVWCKEGPKVSACNCEKRAKQIQGNEVPSRSCKSWQLSLGTN